MTDHIQIMDTTLRDGEQTRGISFALQEKLSIAKMLLGEVNVDRIEVASARVSRGELETVKAITKWAGGEGLLERVEVLSFVNRESIDWANEAGCRTTSILAKGSQKHCEHQLRKTPQQHFSDVAAVMDYASHNGIAVNVYLEDWSNGMKDSPQYVFDFVESLKATRLQRLLLPDTLGILAPLQLQNYLKEMARKIPLEKCDFHAHNDYGLATANSLIAAQEGIGGLHCTVNGLGERTGNAALAEVIAAVNDKAGRKCSADEAALQKISVLLERFSGKKIPSNKPIVGEDVFTQTAGIHADGDAKGNLYVNPLTAERFGRKREYALGKLSGRASLEQNLAALKMDLTPEQKKIILERVVMLGDKKETVTSEDLPFIIADVLNTPLEGRVKITECKISSSLKGQPFAQISIILNGKQISKSAQGNGCYDAFMNALVQAAKDAGVELPELVDYEVRIPPGGKTDAIVETTITWKCSGKQIVTTGIDSDQVMAAIKATEKMLNRMLCKGK
ncbi:MAG TPA: 2-isopropylmalate synthase [Candidatus Diapherotrites archaeon]|uniref:2-isopropylmalate synthase n=1 Tax=Candidatus Iainarchaeum sp. TaxID=3101447 RepID=A0A7J4J423_9ARCH|nr:2-isopropylmalate synthase [Candidatus Diapherotrites archaeon]